jgi:hypothetical protein
LEKTVALHLRNVADTFGQAQYHRNEADYNTARTWNSTEVLLHIDLIADAFKSWSIIREEPAARPIWSPCFRARNGSRMKDLVRRGCSRDSPPNPA